MKNHGPYLIRGIRRLIAAVFAIGLAALVLNVIGYQLIEHDLEFFQPTNWPESYLGRALLLSFVGLIQLAVLAVCAGLGFFILFLAYRGLLHLGGYRDPEPEEPKEQ